jgi:hypothetical protein
MLQGSKATPLFLSAMLLLASAHAATATYTVNYFGPGGVPPVTATSGEVFNFGVYPINANTTVNFQIINNSLTASLAVGKPSCTSSSSVFTVTGGNFTLAPNSTTDITVSEAGPVAAFYSCSFSVTLGGATFTASVQETVAGSTMAAWWNATNANIAQCSTWPFATTPSGTPESMDFVIGNATNVPLDIYSTSVGSNDDCFFLLSGPAASIPPHGSSSGRIRLFSTGDVYCSGEVTLMTSDMYYQSFTFFTSGYVGTAPYTDVYWAPICPAN